MAITKSYQNGDTDNNILKKMLWNSEIAANALTGGIGSITLNVNATFRGPLNNYSGTIAATGVSQLGAPGHGDRHYFLLQNLSSDYDLWVNFGALATAGAPSIVLLPYGTVVIEGSFCSTDAVYVYGTVGQQYAIKEA
jgi:glutamate 5-kinase